jgi:PEP-CTERM motif
MEKRSKITLCLACLAALTLVTANTSMANLLTDPGAEGQVTSPTLDGYNGWSLFNGAAFDNTQAHSGQWSIALNGGAWSVPGAYQQFAASAGQQFTLSGYGMVTNVLQDIGNPGFPWVGLQISYFNGLGIDIGTVETGGVGAYATPASKIEVGEPTGWTFLTVTATAPAGAASVQVFGINLNGGGDAGWVDDLDLVLVPEPSTIALALTGMLGLVAVGWKKRRI